MGSTINVNSVTGKLVTMRAKPVTGAPEQEMGVTVDLNKPKEPLLKFQQLERNADGCAPTNVI